MGIPAGVAEPVLDDDEVAVATAVVAGEDHRADARRADRGPFRDGEVDAGVEVVAAVDAKAVAHRAGDWAQEAHRARRRRAGACTIATAAQCSERFGAGDPVDAEPSNLLSVLHRRFGQWPEQSVGSAGAAADPLQQVLQGRHVPTLIAVAHRAAAQTGSASPPERPPRQRPEDAVDGKPAAPLQRENRPPRQRPLDPVDVAVVEMQGLQRRLQSGDFRG